MTAIPKCSASALKLPWNRALGTKSVRGNSLLFAEAAFNTWYVPFEVLTIFQPRESLGLSVPALNHPLLNTPLGKLPPLTEPYMDETLRSVLERVAQQLPQFTL